MATPFFVKLIYNFKLHGV